MVKKLTPLDVIEICRLYTEDKLSSLEIGKIYNVYDTTIRKQLKKSNILLRTLKESIIISTTHGKGRPKGVIEKNPRKPKDYIPTGAECHSWRGGITPLNKGIRSITKYKEWRKDVYERDNYTCQICNKRGGYLHSDHIIPMCIILSDNNITSLDQAINCEQLWDMTNARTLCVSCHRKTDTYGIKARMLMAQIP